MCELLVQVSDHPSLLKRGDVIVASRSSRVWGEVETRQANMRILVCPDVSESEASVFLSPELATSLDNMIEPKNHRGFYLDLDAMAASFADLREFLADDTRTTPKFQISGSLDAYKRRRAKIENPAVIGSSRKIIG